MVAKSKQGVEKPTVSVRKEMSEIRKLKSKIDAASNRILKLSFPQSVVRMMSDEQKQQFLTPILAAWGENKQKKKEDEEDEEEEEDEEDITVENYARGVTE